MVFKNEKKLLKKSQIKPIQVPQYDELSVKRLWTDLKAEPSFSVYFADHLPGDKMPSREYFYNVLNTIYTDYLKAILAHANK